MRISDWSSDVCSSDLQRRARGVLSFAYFALHKQRKRKRLWSFRRRAAARNQKPDRAKTPVLRAALSPSALLNDSMSFSRAKRSEERRLGKEFFRPCRYRWSPIP